MTAKVLLVEDDPALREALADTLQLAGHRFVALANAEQALRALAKESFDLLISDVNMPGMDGHQLLAQLKVERPDLPVLLMTAYATVERAVMAMRLGAVDYLVKPFEPKTLLELIARHAQGHSAPLDEDGPVAVDASSQQLLTLAKRVAQSDSTVLIVGESGTGKEVLARFIHQHSARAHGPFVALNCAAIPDTMLEALLFGHEKGAFTGAVQSVPGKFEQANGGTLLLDEISELPLALQAKLLRVLQEREVERVGAQKSIRLDIRVLATSNRDLQAEVAAGRFREDLFYRLSVFALAWRPLRQRVDDIVPLAQRLLAKHGAKLRHAPVQLSQEACQTLKEYPWPGNVRELDNAIQRALILQPGSLIGAAELCLQAPLGVMDFAVPAERLTPAAPSISAQAGVDEPGVLSDELKRMEFQRILDTLTTEQGRRKETAERLGISPRTLRYKLAQMREAGFC